VGSGDVWFAVSEPTEEEIGVEVGSLVERVLIAWIFIG